MAPFLDFDALFPISSDYAYLNKSFRWNSFALGDSVTIFPGNTQ